MHSENFIIKIALIFFTTLVSSCVCLVAKDKSQIKYDFVFRGAQFSSVHSATLAEISNGDLICAWFGGAGEKSSDTSIWASRRINGVWTRPQELANGAELSPFRYAAWNPVLWRAPDGILFLIYKIGDSPRMWRGYYKTSNDDGRTWSNPLPYADGILGAVKNKPLALASGRIIAPASTEFHSSFGWFPHFEISDDFGKTWRISKPSISLIQCIQPAIIELGDGRILALMRSRCGFVARTISTDNGETWSKIEPLKVLNPNSGLDAEKLADGTIVMACNPDAERRNRLSIFTSADGKDWNEAYVLESEAANGEFSYPSLLVDSKGKLHAVYTFKRLSIRHAEIDISKK